MRRNHHAINRDTRALLKGGGAAQGLSNHSHGLCIGTRTPKLGPVVIVAMNTKREVRSPRAEKADGTRVSKASIERDHGDSKVIAMHARMVEQLGVVEVPIAGATQVGVIDDEGGTQRRSRWPQARGQLAEEVCEREQREAAPRTQALAQRLIGAKLSGSAGNALAATAIAAAPATTIAATTATVVVEHPDRIAVERCKHDLTSAEDARQRGRMTLAEQRAAQRTGKGAVRGEGKNPACSASGLLTT